MPKLSIAFSERDLTYAHLPRVLPWAELLNAFGAWFLMISIATSVIAQTRSYPKEIRGYKVERTVVEIKKPEAKDRKPVSAPTQNQNADNNANQTNDKSNSESDVDALIQFGKPQLARVTPLGITFEVPIMVAPVKQSGHIDFLLFEDMVVNGTSVEIDEYHRAFDLPNKQPLTLHEPLRIYIYLHNAVLGAIDEWSHSRETWPVTGLVYVCGKFRKSIFSFKRCVPVELNVTMRNPLRAN